ncbi:sugar phosphate isomerase/epimerase [Alicyclobacillus fastidiosus]|uniref:Sugar phosphate isomerase/epimerase n=1 Tax=Alicyclobacillus fastidiosus TaxID=392011 RepID=A0ABY6ZEP3_9BACL|nr:sugar phosphate isomerase/epimerase family protein [Alicyclobacillus fastidiosus]WAH40610.1 sugar phosphate isomerase/epimerase [Alicyclobacillus fastidiosus]GMA62051.1 hypothetical protein GCM10025859_24910 [Alicyclobacillus fastidiosus]
MILSRLGIITDEVSDNFEEALEWANSHHLTHVELRTINRKNITCLSDEDIEYVLSLLQKRRLQVSCIASPVFKCSLNPERPVLRGDTFGSNDEDTANHFNKLRRVIRLAKQMNCKYIRVFSFWREERPQDYTSEIVKYLRCAAEIAQENGVVLLLENEPTCNGGFAEEVAMLVRTVNSPALRVLWDPGNEVYGGRQAYPEGYKFVKDLISHVHLKDVGHDREQHVQCLPIGRGLVPYVEHLIALQEHGYSGLFTLETHYVPSNGTRKHGSELALEGIIGIDKHITSWQSH